MGRVDRALRGATEPGKSAPWAAMRKAAPRRAFALAILALVIATVVGSLAFLLMQGRPDRLEALLRPDIWALFGAPSDNTVQVRAYGCGLLALLVMTGIGIWQCERWPLPSWLGVSRAPGPPGFGPPQPLESLLAVLMVVSTLLWLPGLPETGDSGQVFWGGFSMYPTLGLPQALRSILFGVISLAALLLVRLRLPAGLLGPLALGLAGADLLVLLVPGLWQPLRLEGIGYADLLTLDAHYGILLGDRLQLREGLPLVSVVEPRYGFLLPVLAAIGERLFGALDVGQNVRLVQWSQVGFLGIFTAALLVQARGAWLGVAVALLLVAPWLGTLHMSVFHPNQAGYRYLGFGVALLAMAWLCRQEAAGRPLAMAPWLLGGVAGLAMLLNYETGAVVGFGTVLYLLLGLPVRGWWPALAKVALRYAACVLAAHAAFWLLVLVGLDMPPAPLAGLFWPLFSHNVESIIGRPLQQDPWITVIAGASAVALVRPALAWRWRAPGTEARLLAAVGGMLLLWLTYWISRPHIWSDWSYFVLFGPFVVALLRPSVLDRILALGRRRRSAPAALVLALAVLPAVYVGQRHNLPPAWRALTRRPEALPAGARLISGVWLSAAVADQLEAKAVGIRATAALGTVVYMSAHAFSLAVLSGHPLPLARRELLFGLKTERDFDDYVGEVMLLAPERILIDDEAAPAAMPLPMRHTLDAVQRALAGTYAPVAGLPGWRVLERQPGVH